MNAHTPTVPRRHCASALVAAFLVALAFLTAHAQMKWTPGHYMQIQRGDGDVSQSTRFGYYDEVAFKNNASIVGVVVPVRWKQLEGAQGNYSAGIAMIAAEIVKLKSLPAPKKLYLRIIDNGYGQPATDIFPPYMVSSGAMFQTATSSIWRKWNATYMDYYIAMVSAYAAAFDNEPYFEGLYLIRETAPGWGGTTPPPDFSDAAYETQLRRLALAAKTVWTKTNVIMPTNFMPGGQTAMNDHIAYLSTIGVGIGGPDVLPPPHAGTWAYKTLTGTSGGHDYRGEIPVQYSIEASELGGGLGDYSPAELFAFANNTLRCSHLFWDRNFNATSEPSQQWPAIMTFISSNPLTHTAQPAVYGQPPAAAVQFETATIAAHTDPYTIRSTQADVLFQATGTGDSITFSVPSVTAGTYSIAVTVEKGPNRGIFQLESSTSLGGTYTAHGSPQDTYNSVFGLGHTLAVASNVNFSTTGTRYFRFRVTGTNAPNGYYLALDKMTLTATAAAPEANVLGNGVSIADGDTTPSTSDYTNLGSTGVASGTLSRSFTVQNNGTGALTLGTVALSGTNMADFSITSQPAASVAAGASTTFAILFNPSGGGARNAALSFATSDANENPYNFSIQGTGLTPTLYQAESLTIAASSGDPVSTVAAGGASGGNFRRYDSGALNDYITLTVNAPSTGSYLIKVRVQKTPWSAVAQLAIDGVNQGLAMDMYASASSFAEFTLGTKALSAGNHAFKFTVTGMNSNSTDKEIRLDLITLEP